MRTIKQQIAALVLYIASVYETENSATHASSPTSQGSDPKILYLAPKRARHCHKMSYHVLLCSIVHSMLLQHNIVQSSKIYNPFPLIINDVPLPVIINNPGSQKLFIIRGEYLLKEFSRAAFN